jgi:hypothetical protein
LPNSPLLGSVPFLHIQHQCHHTKVSTPSSHPTSPHRARYLSTAFSTPVLTCNPRVRDPSYPSIDYDEIEILRRRATAHSNSKCPSLQIPPAIEGSAPYLFFRRALSQKLAAVCTRVVPFSLFRAVD